MTITISYELIVLLIGYWMQYCFISFLIKDLNSVFTTYFTRTKNFRITFSIT